MTRVGFEPTHISVVEISGLKSTALDHSAIVSGLLKDFREVKRICHDLGPGGMGKGVMRFGRVERVERKRKAPLYEVKRGGAG